MRVSRRRGVIRLNLEPVEARMLAQLVDELDDLIETMAPEDEPTRRLFPSGYRDDDDAARQFRELTEESLREVRRVRYGVIRAALPAAGGTVEIADDDRTPWLTTINDIRLALGTRLGVSEDEPDIDPADDAAQTWAVYYWLTALQDSLVRAAMR
jgi:hypothetical protein